MSELQQDSASQKFFYPNGDWYIGDFSSKREKHCAQGTFYSREQQTVYIGGFQNDSYSGVGKLQNLYTLETLSGQFREGKAEGKCNISFANGSTFTGKYMNGVREGYGKWNFVEGSVFEGEYHGGKRNGLGSLTFADGRVFKGSYVDNMREGKGKITNKAGQIEFEGNYKRGKKEGVGKSVFPNGDIYEGMFVQDEIQGEGNIKYKNGEEWSGQWSEGKQNGKGMMVKTDGSK